MLKRGKIRGTRVETLQGLYSQPDEAGITMSPIADNPPAGPQPQNSPSTSHQPPLPEQKKHTNHDKNGFWGPHYWGMLHCCAASFTPCKKQAFIQFVNTLPDLLPCKLCANHLREHLAQSPPEQYATSRDRVFLWTYYIHDKVNRSKTPPVQSPSYAEIKKHYYDNIEYCTACAAQCMKK